MRFPHFSSLFFFFLLAFFSVSSAFAAQHDPFKIYTTRDGLAGDYVTAIAFASDGSAWVGTTEGATHIEPQRWTSYTRVHGLGDSWITALAIARDQRVWFGTHSGGVSVFDPNAKTFTTYKLDNSEIPSNFVTQLIIDSKKYMWVGTLNNGVAQFDPGTQRWSRHALTNTSITYLLHGFDERRTLWAIADGRVYALNGGKWELRELPNDESAVGLFDDHRQMVAVTRERMFLWNGETWEKYVPFQGRGLSPSFGILKESDITASAEGTGDDLWYGTPRGLYVLNPLSSLKPPPPLPVVLIHGWTVAGDDTLETSEFRFLKSYADRDGIPMYYVRGVSPKNTLYQNAQVIRDEIARVKRETGADKVNIVAFSMGGMNARAYLETSLYANDVNRAIILGTPQAGVDIWKPILFQQILAKPDEPSAIELSPEYAQRIVNATRLPNPNVPYDLLIGDARQQAGLEFLDDMPASDALISVASALALDPSPNSGQAPPPNSGQAPPPNSGQAPPPNSGQAPPPNSGQVTPNVRKHINADLHDWGPEAVPLDLTGYLYPRDTWERYLRNALRNNDNAPIGSEVLTSPLTPLPKGEGNLPPSPAGGGVGGEVWTGNHTPVVTAKIRAGETVTRTVLIDENKSARFIAYYPGGKMDFSIIAPDRKKYEPSDLPREDEAGVLSLSTDIANFSGYVVKNASVGKWELVLTRTDRGEDGVDVSAYVELDAPLTLNALVRWQTLDLGASNIITGSVRMDSGKTVREVKMTARVAQPATVPGEPYSFTEIELFDDGKHNDGVANDGFFANDFKPARAGWHLVFVNAEGNGFTRATEFLIAVNPNDAQIESPATFAHKNDLWTLDVTVTVHRAGQYALRLSFWNPALNYTIVQKLDLFAAHTGTNVISIPLDREPRECFADSRLLDVNGAAFETDHINQPCPWE
ncbi:MAG: alpha/beta fold hydrolase [Chloroflexi bacterium]|nr:alpha/beta fold hydrolase [Chloroflexota bacterium]